ncbi:AAA family ATPase [Gemmatimonas sp.]|uniref:AAA family ATPase n=1 Tax=Gemmatimonas sp. TaxID=1962908 RepID=UPI0038B2EAFC
MPSYLARIVDAELDDLLQDAAAIALDGPKGVGKTATAARRASTVIVLDDPLQRDLTLADLDAVLRRSPPVLLDEWQRLPQTWDAVRRAVDRDDRPAQFLLTGSASPEGPATPRQAGRILRVRMYPMLLAERGRNRRPSRQACQTIDAG